MPVTVPTTASTTCLPVQESGWSHRKVAKKSPRGVRPQPSGPADCYFRLPVTFVEPAERPELSRNPVRDPDWVAVPVVRPELSRKVVLFPDVEELPVVRPELSRNVVRFPLVDAEPVVRPELSRKVVLFPDVEALPVVRPELSRNVVRFPDVDDEPTVRPLPSDKVARSPLLERVPICRVALSLPGGFGFTLFSANNKADIAMNAMPMEGTIRRFRMRASFSVGTKDIAVKNVTAAQRLPSPGGESRLALQKTLANATPVHGMIRLIFLRNVNLVRTFSERVPAVKYYGFCSQSQ